MRCKMHFCYERDRGSEEKEKNSSEAIERVFNYFNMEHLNWKKFTSWHANDLKLFLAVVVAVVGS